MIDDPRESSTVRGDERTDARVLSTGPGSIHERLRQATAEQHRRLDDGLAYVFSERLTTEAYAELLVALFGFYAPLERCLARWSAAPPFSALPPVWRAGSLARDLHVLERSPEQIPVCTAIPDLSTADHIAGAIYVVEGASLGGQVIARSVGARLGLGRDNGAAFFTGHGAWTGTRWKQVLAWLDQQARSGRGDDRIVTGACRTFAALGSWLSAREVLL